MWSRDRGFGVVTPSLHFVLFGGGTLFLGYLLYSIHDAYVVHPGKVKTPDWLRSADPKRVRLKYSFSRKRERLSLILGFVLILIPLLYYNIGLVTINFDAISFNFFLGTALASFIGAAACERIKAERELRMIKPAPKDG